MTIDEARPYIEAALYRNGGTHSFDDIQAGVAAGHYQFWPGVQSAMITEIIEYPKFKVLHCFLAGGNLAEIEVMVPVVEEWGREQGCTRAMFTGRRGWERSFLTQPRYGYEPYAISFTKEL
jgi:hypothetical protein